MVKSKGIGSFLFLPERLGFILLTASAAALAMAAGGFIMAAAQSLKGVLLACGFLLLGAVLLTITSTGPRRALNRIRAALRIDSAPRLLINRRGKTIYANPAFKRSFPDSTGREWSYFKDILCDEPRNAGKVQTLLAYEDNHAPAVEIVDLGGDFGPSWVSCIPMAIPESLWLWSVDPFADHADLEMMSARGGNPAMNEFVAGAPVGFYSLDQTGRFHMINHVFAKSLGMTPEEIVEGDNRLSDFIVGAMPDGTNKNEPPVIPEDGRIALCGRQGRLLHARIFQNTAMESDGTEITRGMIYDVTQEAELEKALRETMRRFQKLFHAAPTGIALLDLDGRIVECNAVMSKLLGQPPETGSVPLGQFAVAEEKAKFDELIKALVERGEAQYAFEAQLPASNNTEKRMGRFFASRLENDVGDISGLILHGLDTTEQKQLEVQFAQSQKMQAVGQLAGGIAHDFNNLLTAMLGFCDLLLQRHQPGEQSFADVMQIKQNANRAANLVRQLLAFSRQQTVRPKTLDLTDILADISHLLRRLIGETTLLEIKHGRDIGPIRMDQGQLEQVIVNLAVNARDAMPDGGTLTIRTENVDVRAPLHSGPDVMPVGEYVLIEVSDTGIGIEPETLAHIFEPFYSTKEVGSGTGLGLSTVEGIVRQSGGYVFAESTPGQGAIFRIYLPRHTHEEDEEGAETAEEAAGLGDLTGVGTILLVEDEDAVRLFSARALRNKGYTVLEARSGNTAVELLEHTKERIDLLVTDVVMPDMDGPALISWMSENRPNVRVICISGYAEESVRQRITQSSDITFLSKPFTLNDLAGAVKKVFSKTAS